MKKLLLLLLIPFSLFAEYTPWLPASKIADRSEGYCQARIHDGPFSNRNNCDYSGDGCIYRASNNSYYYLKNSDGDNRYLLYDPPFNCVDECSENQTFNYETGKCEDTTPTCAADEHLDIVNNVCVKNCPIDQLYLSDKDQCVSSCPSGTHYSSVTATCEIVDPNDSNCSSLSSTKVSISKPFCKGYFKNYDLGYSGQLTWQECDNTCYLLERIPLKCDEIFNSKIDGCDVSKSVPDWSCVDAISFDGIPTFHFSCNSTGDYNVTSGDNNSSIESCYRAKEKMLSECPSPKVLLGSCSVLPSGNIVNDYKCVDPDKQNDPCLEAYNTLSKVCTGKVVGNCSTDAFTGEINNTLSCDSDLNSTKIDDSKIITTINDSSLKITSSIDDLKNKITDKLNLLKNNSDQSNKYLSNIDKGIASLKPILESSNNKLDSIDGKLSSIDSQAANTNNLLNQINDKLDVDPNRIDAASGLGNFDSDAADAALGIDTSSLDDSADFLDNLEDNMAYLTDNITSIKDDFENTKALLEGGVPETSISTGSCSNENLNKFASMISPYSPAIALLVYVEFMVSIFKMIFLYFGRSE